MRHHAISAIIFCSLLAPAVPAAELVLPDSPTTFADGRAPVEDLYEAYASLLQRGWFLDVIIESQPEGADYALPIIALRSPQGGEAVWILSGVHGEETAGPNAIAATIDELATLGDQRAVVLLPLNNPHGYARNWRYLNMPVYSSEVEGQSVGDSSHLLPDTENPGQARVAAASSAEADAITRYIIALSASYPPAYSIDLHEDNLISEGYVYSQGELGAADPLAGLAVSVLKANGIPIKAGGTTRFDEPISNGIIGPVIDSSIDELMSAPLIVLDGEVLPGPEAGTVLVFETPAGEIPLASRTAAHAALLRELSQALGTAQLACDVQGAALSHAREVLKSTPLIDGHNDLPWVIRETTAGDVQAFGLEGDAGFDTDIPKLRAGQVGAQFWSVWIPGELAELDYGRVQMEQIDTMRRIINAYPDTFELALTADDIERIFASGKIASLIGMEGGYALYNSMGVMRAYYDLGVRYMTLSHNVTLDWVDAALGEQTHGGLTDFGRAMVQEMNRTGMLVDLAHTSPAAMHQALDVSKAPVIWSHAAARGLVDHPRNVPDDVLKRLPENGGVVMVTFVPSFLSQEAWDMEEALWATDAVVEKISEFRAAWLAYDAEHGAVRATIGMVADHIEHVRDVAGIDHVGIGSDYWGMPDGPIGLEDASGFPHLFAELICRGWSDPELEKLAGQNVLKVMRQAESVATQASVLTIDAAN